MDIARFFLRESDGARLMLRHCRGYTFVEVWSPSASRPFGDRVDTFRPPEGDEGLRLSGEHILERTADLLAQGYRRTNEHLCFSDETDPGPQPEWATALDEVVLADRCDLPTIKKLIDDFASRPEAAEPCFVEIRARRAVANGQATPPLLGLLSAALEALRDSDLDGTPIYIGDAHPPELRERLHTIRFALLRTDGPIDEALDAGRRAEPFVTLRERVAFFQQHAPEEMDDCWDDLFWMRNDPAYADLTGLDGYVAYHARRVAADRGPAAFRWRHGPRPARPGDLDRASKTLGLQLPEDYRQFIEAGRLHLVVTRPDRTTGVHFAEADDLVRRRTDFCFSGLFEEGSALHIYSGPDEGLDVPCQSLLWVADCAIQSNTLCAHFRADEPPLWYFWYHDGQYELYFAADSFAAAVARLERANTTENDQPKMFLEIYGENDEDT